MSVAARCQCGRKWTGRAEAHCGWCHEHFGSIRAFDNHRVVTDGKRVCRAPGSLRFESGARKGEPKLRPVHRAHGTVWVGAGRRPESLTGEKAS